MTSRTSDFFPAAYFRRQDESPGSRFHSVAREEPYLDRLEQASFQDLALRLVEPGGNLLDLLAGAHSYLPPALRPTALVGLGLNPVEMGRNPQLSAFLVQDLNQQPLLPFADGAFDAALCTCGVQYLVRPVELFSEVKRVLKPGGVFLVSFTRGCYPGKTIAFWLATRPRQRQLLVGRYFAASGGWQEAQMAPALPPPGAPELDGLHAVWARKN